MKIIEYSPDGIAFADSKAEEQAKEFLKSNKTEIKVSTENFILAARALIHDKFIAYTEVNFLFEDTIIIPNVEGRLTEWPNGFCTYSDFWLDRILTKQE